MSDEVRSGMGHLEVLREIGTRGLRITATGTDLRLQGPKELIDADLVARIRAHKAELLAHLDGPTGFPLTELQRGYVVGREGAVEIGNVASHIYHEIEGVWDLDRLEAALRSVVARHGILRTRFTAEATQIEQPSVPVRIDRLDLRGQSPALQAGRRAALREQRSHRILPLDRAPLLAVEVTILADDAMVLHVGHDGLVLDAISMFLFFRDWWSAYQGEADDTGPAASFADYVAELRAARTRAPAERSRRYWLARLDDLPAHPDLPLRTSPAAITRPRFVQHTVRVDAPDWRVLTGRAADAGLTPTTLLLAAYAETLYRWGAGPRFTLNSTVANRPPIHPRIADALGNFSETMLVEITLDRRSNFAERARALQGRLRRDLDNRHFSGIAVLRELGRRRGTAAARMPYTFNSALGHGHVDGSTLELFGPEVYTSSQTPQVWLNGFAFEQHGGLVVQFDEVAGLFPEGLVEAMVSGYRTLLAKLAQPAAWSATEFDLLPAEQRQRRRVANDTAVALPEVMLPDAFARQASDTPDAPAVLAGDVVLSYRELYRRAALAAAWLREHRVARDEPVALVMNRGPEQIIAILAVLLAGGAYLPVDAALPAARRDHMLADAGVRCVLTNTALPVGDGRQVLVLDAAAPVEGGSAAPPPLPGAGPDDLAYVLYTSGTTGTPKGVMISHRSVVNVVADCNRRFGVGPADRFFAVSAFTFDLSVYDVFGALSAGAAVVLPDAERATDPGHWLRRCAETGVTVWNSVPAIVSLLHEAATDETATDQAIDTDPLASLRLVMMSGDRIPPGLPAELRKVHPDLELVSLGGPTETTIWNILHPIGADDDGSDSIPYGRPNANNRAYVLDADGQDTPDWVVGEICAAGAGLARGYWHDEAHTAQRFVVDDRRGERLYRTGDLGRYLPSGEIAILGRADFQIKINGYRIEAGEVETRLVALDEVAQAVVVRQDAADGARLVAHLVPAGTDRPGEAGIRAALRAHLPGYMVPAAVYWHGSLPLTRNGKLDRARLEVPQAAVPTAPATPSAADGAAGGELERRVAGIWARVLRVDDLDAGHSLYELGGDSITAARILTAVRKEFGVSITLDRMAEVDTVRTMAAHLAAAATGGAVAR